MKTFRAADGRIVRRKASEEAILQASRYWVGVFATSIAALVIFTIAAGIQF